jgi:hypothetical protein
MTGPPDTPTDRTPVPDAGVRNYTFLCLVALLGVLLVQMVALPRAGALWVLLPVLIGLAGLLLRWQAAPLVFLLTLGGVLYVNDILQSPFRATRPVAVTSPGIPLLLAIAALAYVAGHYRLQSLVKRVFPPDPRRAPGPRRPGAATPARRPSPQVPERRSPALASPGELAWLLLALPSWGLLALIAYRVLVLHDSPDLFGNDVPWATADWSDSSGVPSLQVVTDVLWHGRLLLWVLGFGTLVVSGVIGAIAWGRASRAEAEVFLHDTVWRETRREQRLLVAWRVWARWRRGRGKDNP